MKGRKQHERSDHKNVVSLRTHYDPLEAVVCRPDQPYRYDISAVRPQDSPRPDSRRRYGKAGGICEASGAADRIRDLLLSRPRFDAAFSWNADRIPLLPFRKRDDRPRALPILRTRRSWRAGALLRLTKGRRGRAHRHRSSNLVLQPIPGNEGFTGSAGIG